MIPKGGYQKLKAAGTEALRQAVARLAPPVAHALQYLQGWNDLPLLSAESSRVQQWSRTGLLLIGDAAQVMSPVDGVGINYAVQDTVAASTLLGPKLRAGRIEPGDLDAVQFRIPLPVRVILNVLILRGLPARLIGFGFDRERVEQFTASVAGASV